MHIHTRLLAAALALLVIASPTALAAEVPEAADRAALEAAAQSWIRAFNARDAGALAALATPDVVILDPDSAPVSGRENARRIWARALAATQGRVETVTKEAAIHGDIAWRIAALARTLPNGDVVSREQSLEIWKRENGAWKLHRQMSSGMLTGSKLLPRPVPSEPVLDKPAD